MRSASCSMALASPSVMAFRAFASFCAYSLAHNLGFAAVSGAAVRYRLYAHWGLTPFQIAKTVAFLASEDSGFTTGHYLPVNGGLAMD